MRAIFGPGGRGLYLQLRMHVLLRLHRRVQRDLSELRRRADPPTAAGTEGIVGRFCETPVFASDTDALQLGFSPVFNPISQETFVADNAHILKRTVHTRRKKFFA